MSRNVNYLIIVTKVVVAKRDIFHIDVKLNRSSLLEIHEHRVSVPFHELYQIDDVVIILVPTSQSWTLVHCRVMAIILFTWLVVYSGNEVVFRVHCSFMRFKKSTWIQVAYRIVNCRSDSGFIIHLVS
jgi:hypothetical protein